MVKYLAGNMDKDIFQKDIEEVFSLRASSVSATLKKLEGKGFITKEAVDYDARLKRIRLTDKALDLHKEKILQFENIERKIEKTLTENEINELGRLLDKLSEALD
jgi:DNA-binding MarR family transcriptional regulator